MLTQAINSVIIGGLLSLLLYVPVVIFQYRRYGKFSFSRSIWLCIGLVYLTAVISYTLFPLPNITADFCATHPRHFILDPTLYFRDMVRSFTGRPLSELLRSEEMMQMVLNVVLFVPLGVIVRQLWGFGAGRTVALGFAMSLTIELTQYTGNWFLEPCSYRVADINDLLANTLGALFGAVLALFLPRLAADPAIMAAQRMNAQALTRSRRWMGQLLDLMFTGMVVNIVLMVQDIGIRLFTGSAARSEQTQLIIDSVAVGLTLCYLLAFSLIGNGASLGQRIVFLCPTPKGGARWRLILRSMIVQGVGVSMLLLPNIWWSPPVWVVLLAFASVALTPHGISCLASGCTMVDVRANGAPAAC
ncbi:MAG: VanZ family protein [Propionibacteriaceae bacterium]|jgi:glycopeptide antibiotics resistance protein|nr:VanZ family protein [Propionibacteriaceae bacterium]